MPRKTRWSKIVEAHGERVRIYERPGGTLWRSVMIGPDGNRTKDRRSLRTKDRRLAECLAKALAEELAKARLNGFQAGDALTLGAVFGAYRVHRLPTLSESWGKAAEMRIALFEEAWGRGQLVGDLSQSDVDAFVKARRSGELSPLAARTGRGTRKVVRVRDGTLDADFRWLSSVFNWARKLKRGGKRLLRDNPLHDVEWPKEKNPRRPVASHQRFVATMEHVDTLDPEGRLRLILALARYTGRRESAICALHAGDLLLSPEWIRSALAAAGLDERVAESMPHGAIRWREATDKMGFLNVTPISAAARQEIDRYLERSPRLGDAPLFPAPDDPAQPVQRHLAADWLLRAEQLAELPKLRGGTFHPYRRLWATERKHLPLADVAAAGGWRSTAALQHSYIGTDPDTILKVVENG